ncbi:MAG: J domain-containing protein [Alphaproteobacteria bacterium]|nr:J domain-containing protein [Alphaproteobacteria bacterium]MBF0373948.1 J domain-containing protein [Alphaproteobacteria bacterium]MBF0393405.1 J domain-containing protein [Alphaproteobacteria bacterium]
MSGVLKQSYTVPCASAFRDAVEALATRRKVNVGDLARSVMLLLPLDAIAAHPDPGEPGPGDRETIVLKTGRAAGRPWRRKPRLQVRMPPGQEPPLIRRALAIALQMDFGTLRVSLGEPTPPPPPANDVSPETREELERLRAIVNVLAFDPLPGGISSRQEALHVLGFPPGADPDQRSLRAKFRLLATIHHPDAQHGDHMRMSQLNAAMDLLRRGAA